MTPCDPAEAWFAGTLVVVERLGSQSFGHLELPDGPMITVAFDRTVALAPGDRVAGKGDPAAVPLFDSGSGKRLN